MTVRASAKGSSVRVFPGRASQDHAAADLVVQLSGRSVASRGRFTVAFSGGATPRGLFRLLASLPYRDRVGWKSTHVFWADERAVAPGHEDSNFRVAQELLLSQVPVARENVHRIRGEDDPSSAATAYEQEIRTHFGHAPLLVDLISLGMGADGHTASLFPGSPALSATERLVLSTGGPDVPQERITLTLTAINRSRMVLFLVAGAEKADMVRRVLQGPDRERYPAARVQAATGDVLWFLDGDAAMLLGAAS